MIYDLEKYQNQHNPIAIEDEDGLSLTYKEMISLTDDLRMYVPTRSLVFILSENKTESLAFYIFCLNNGIVPLIIGSQTDEGLLKKLLNTYDPNFIWKRKGNSEESIAYAKHLFEFENYELVSYSNTKHNLNSDLSLLLSTSGSTGSPKLVRHSYNNILESAKSVSLVFNIEQSDKALLPLPLQYTMGLSVASSHIYSGATVVLSNSPLTDIKFWNLLKTKNVSSITGVPYTYEILEKLRFFRKDLPHLKTISQGGGKLSNDLFKRIANHCEVSNKKFIATYGQTEGTARMAYLDPALASRKTGSIGKAIPNGRLFLKDENGKEMEGGGISGELFYSGPNVTMGYATKKEDLSKPDENNGILATGDLAFRDEDDCYYIRGRKKRFLKLFGVRIGLDEVEHLVKTEFKTDCYCSGSDKLLEVYIDAENLEKNVLSYISKKIGIYQGAIRVYFVEEIKRNEFGKVILTQ